MKAVVKAIQCHALPTVWVVEPSPDLTHHQPQQSLSRKGLHLELPRGTVTSFLHTPDLRITRADNYEKAR
jgi:hypothetical protein